MTESERSHVLILVQNLPVPFDRRVWMEATTLRQEGYSVSVVCPTGAGCTARREEIDGVSIWRYRGVVEGRGVVTLLLEYSVALLSMISTAMQVNRQSRVRVVQICNPPDLLFIAALPLRLLFGARVIFDHHDLIPELVRAKGHRRGGLLERLSSVLERSTFAAADVVISTNESYRRVALMRGKKKERDVFVVRSAPRLNSLSPVPERESLRRGARYLVGYLGVMGVQEGLDHLIDAAEIIAKARGERYAHFVLVGGGPELPHLERVVAQRNLGEVVTFTGRIPDADLAEVLSTSDVCVNPDSVNELNNLSTMNKIVEYMALGKPIVQFDLKEGRASAREASLYAVGEDGQALADCLVRLLDDKALRLKMGAAGRRRFDAELAWEYQAPALLAAYRRVLKA